MVIFYYEKPDKIPNRQKTKESLYGKQILRGISLEFYVKDIDFRLLFVVLSFSLISQKPWTRANIMFLQTIQVNILLK